jgi:clan AA aspartic protease (TIGR02281 family)
MDHSDGGRQPDRRGKRESGIARQPTQASDFPEPRRRPSRYAPSTITRIVAYGAWILIFLLVASILRQVNEMRPASIKTGLSAVKTEQAHASVPQEEPPPEVPAVSNPPAEVAESAEAPPQAMATALPLPSAPATKALTQEPAATPRIAELVLTPAPNGNFYTEGEINRQKVMFVVDTGASAVSIPDKLRWKLNLTRGRYLQSSTANGMAGMYETQVNSLSVGQGQARLHLENIDALLNPGAPDDVVLLGMTALREVRMIQQNGRMILQQEIPPENAAESAPSAPPPKLRKSVKDCMGTDKVINDRVLKCMQGEEKGEEAEEAQAE